MNKFWVVFIVLILVIGFIFITIMVVINGKSTFSVEIETNPGVKVFAKLPSGEEQFLNSVSKFDNVRLSQIKVDVPINADVILRYDNNEEIIANKEIIANEKSQENKVFVVDFNELIIISINANPWAYVFIKLPDSDDFIKPREQDFVESPDPEHPNLTPIRGKAGSLQVPIGTTIKLEYNGKEMVFSYETWKENSQIWYDFLNQ